MLDKNITRNDQSGEREGKNHCPKMTNPRASGEGCDGDSDLLFHRCELEDGKFDLPSFRLTAKGGSERC